jgi:hypothetical protein
VHRYITNFHQCDPQKHTIQLELSTKDDISALHLFQWNLFEECTVRTVMCNNFISIRCGFFDLGLWILVYAEDQCCESELIELIHLWRQKNKWNALKVATKSAPALPTLIKGLYLWWPHSGLHECNALKVAQKVPSSAYINQRTLSMMTQQRS